MSTQYESLKGEIEELLEDEFGLELKEDSDLENKLLENWPTQKEDINSHIEDFLFGLYIDEIKEINETKKVIAEFAAFLEKQKIKRQVNPGTAEPGDDRSNFDLLKEKINDLKTLYDNPYLKKGPAVRKPGVEDDKEEFLGEALNEPVVDSIDRSSIGGRWEQKELEELGKHAWDFAFAKGFDNKQVDAASRQALKLLIRGYRSGFGQEKLEEYFVGKSKGTTDEFKARQFFKQVLSNLENQINEAINNVAALFAMGFTKEDIKKLYKTELNISDFPVNFEGDMEAVKEIMGSLKRQTAVLDEEILTVGLNRAEELRQNYKEVVRQANEEIRKFAEHYKSHIVALPNIMSPKEFSEWSSGALIARDWGGNSNFKMAVRDELFSYLRLMRLYKQYPELAKLTARETLDGLKEERKDRPVEAVAAVQSQKLSSLSLDDKKQVEALQQKQRPKQGSVYKKLEETKPKEKRKSENGPAQPVPKNFGLQPPPPLPQVTIKVPKVEKNGELPKDKKPEVARTAQADKIRQLQQKLKGELEKTIPQNVQKQAKAAKPGWVEQQIKAHEMRIQDKPKEQREPMGKKPAPQHSGKKPGKA